MKLDLTKNKGKLSYKVNDSEEFTAFDNILREKNLKYRLAISMVQRGVSLQFE